MSSPFAETAVLYHMRGWHPFPLWDPNAPAGMEARGKAHPPKGFTGRTGRNATREEIEEWRDSNRYYNIGCRMPDNVVAIDVDAYHGGAETIAELECRLGRLPATYMVTARTDGSGHRYYQVPGRRVWRNPGPGVEIIHWGWRYAVFPPSIHPDLGTPYKWFDPNGREMENQLGPRPEQLPKLPAKWIKYLDTGQDPKAPATADLNIDEIRNYLREWGTDDDPCYHMQLALKEAFAASVGGRHDACMRAQLKILRYSEAGHPGGRTAIRELKRWFAETAGAERDIRDEWRRGLIKAAQMIAANPTPQNRRGCMPWLAPKYQVVTIKPAMSTVSLRSALR